MKKKFAFVIALLLGAVLHFPAVGQETKFKKISMYPLISEDNITSISVSDNIDVVLIPALPKNVSVKCADKDLGKIKVLLDDKSLYLATMKNLDKNERILIYIHVNGLESLTLNGNSFATSRGILNSRHLEINSKNGARAFIKSSGKLLINTEGKYEVSKRDEDYSSVFIGE